MREPVLHFTSVTRRLDRFERQPNLIKTRPPTAAAATGSYAKREKERERERTREERIYFKTLPRFVLLSLGASCF